jgi:hypothetical protein
LALSAGTQVAQGQQPQLDTEPPFRVTAPIQVESAGPDRMRLRVTFVALPPVWYAGEVRQIFEAASFTFEQRDGSLVIRSSGPATVVERDSTRSRTLSRPLDMTISSDGNVRFGGASRK